MENNSSVKININQILEPKPDQISLSVYQCKFSEYIDENNKNLPEGIRKIILNDTFGFGESQSFIGKNIAQEHYGSAILDLKNVNPLIEFNMGDKRINLQVSQNNIERIVKKVNNNDVLKKIKQNQDQDQDINIDEIRIAMYDNFMKNKEFQVNDIEFLAKQLIDKDPNLANVCLLSQILPLNKNESSISSELKESILKYYKAYFSKKDISYKEIEFAIMTNQQYIKLFFDEPKKDSENDLFKIINDNRGKDQDEYKKDLQSLLLKAKILDISYLNLKTIEGIASYLQYLEEKLESFGKSLQPDYQQLNEVARLKIEEQEKNALNEFTETTGKIDALIKENKTKIYEEGGEYIERLSNLKFCDQENHNIQELNEILGRNLVFRAQKDLLTKSIEKLRGHFEDGFSRGDFFDRIEKIDEAMKDLLDNYLEDKIKTLFPSAQYYKDLKYLSSNYLFFQQMDVKYADGLYQEINKSTENQVFLDVLKVEYLSYLISNNLIFDEKYQNDINKIFEILTIKATNIFSKPRTITDIFSRKMIDKMQELQGEIKIADNALKIMTPSLKVEDLKYLLPKVTLEQLFDLCRNTKGTQEEVRSEIFRAIKEEINNNVQFSSKLYDILREGGEKFVETIKFLATKQEGQSSALISSEQLFAFLNKAKPTPLHCLTLKDSKNFLETIKFLATKQEGQESAFVSSEQLFALLDKDWEPENQQDRWLLAEFYSPLHCLTLKDSKNFLETIKFLTTKQEGQESSLILSEQLFKLLNKKNEMNKTPLHHLKDENLLKTIKFLATKQEGQESSLMSSEQLLELLSKQDQWKQTPLHRFAEKNPEIFFGNIEFLATKQEGQESAFMSSDTLLKILGENFRDTSQPLLDGLAQQNPEIFLKAIKSLLKIPSIRSEGHNFLKPIFNAFYGQMSQSELEAKKVNKIEVNEIVQDIYFNLAVTPIVNDETVYRHAHYLAKNKEEKLNDYGCFMLCFFPLAIGEKGYKYVKHIKKEEALCGFTLPKKPEDMILKYSQHRSPKDILDNCGEVSDGLTNLANAINKLKPNKIKEFLQNLYKNDSSESKSKFEELVYKISQSNEELKGRLEKIEFNTGNTGIASKIFSCFKNTPKEPPIKIVDIIVRGALKAEAKTQEELVEQEDAKADFELKDINESVIPNKGMANEINPREYKTLQQKTMQLAGV